MNKYVNINGEQTEAPQGAVAWKYTDATDNARWIYDADEAREIASEDPSLIEWVYMESED